MKQPTIFLYCYGIDDVLLGSSKVAGIQVQMSFWAKTFVKHGWTVYALSKNKSYILDGIHFLYKKTNWLSNLGLSIIVEPFEAMRYMRMTNANLVFVRGERRDLYSIKRVCDFYKAKLVFLGASDRDFELGNEWLQGAKLNLTLYRKAVNRVTYFVTQNQQQSDNLYRYYGKQSVIIPNIWYTEDILNGASRIYDAVWVANLRRLKRAEWFVNLAQKLPQYKFAIAGGVNEQDYYDHIKEMSETVPNLSFLGAQSLNAVNNLMGQSRLLVCTSEYEGFPNTFLQAWAYDVPIVSTVNPSNFISDCGLGAVVVDEEQLIQSVTKLLVNKDVYVQCQDNIKNHFKSHHDAEVAYKKVMVLINKGNNLDQKM